MLLRKIRSHTAENFAKRGNTDSTDWDEDWLIIGLMSMDQNYYDHFIKYGQEDPEFTSLFLGVGGSGRNYGIEGGIGVFGSIAMDRAFIPIKGTDEISILERERGPCCCQERSIGLARL
ncbi:MAG: hypothetical protein Ct9H300mP9_1590 [Candidatus Neomarinimicrobiota bacterium]|nr:MAG: hypothetical protein Ct9H300mP9_1590 [Candidatus Neomarinimicrobiota bacterium]